MKLASIFMSLFFAISAQAQLYTTSKGSVRGIRNSEVLSIEGMTSKTTKADVTGAVARKIRFSYHKQGMELSKSEFKEIYVGEAVQILQESTQEQKGLTAKEVEKLEAWIEDKMVDSVVVMDFSFEKNGRTGMVSHFIFLSDDLTSQPVLTISVMAHAE